MILISNANGHIVDTFESILLFIINKITNIISIVLNNLKNSWQLGIGTCEIISGSLFVSIQIKKGIEKEILNLLREPDISKC